ncbi:hypothetical protein D3C84_902380 [compost metagenome]
MVTGDVVPDHLDTALRDREGVVAIAGEIGQAVTVIDRCHVQGAALGRLVDIRRYGHGSVGGINRDFIRLGIALEHRYLAIGEFVLVLVDGRRGDGEQRLFIGERVGQEALAVHGSGVFWQATGPGRNRAIGIAGLLGAQRGQAGAELVRLFRRHRGHHVDGQQAQGQGAALQNRLAH